MNSTKSKKKSKSAKIPKPIKIKKEDDHIMYPMAHYVDDRVELIRQIFSSLKPKTITNLAPDFLKKNKLEDIQEQCLNEILGISKKRLLSIINSTKCPTDTETSSDDDVNSIEEHISLEEISSDSDIAEQKGSKASKADGKKKHKAKVGADSENNKQFSVLELLELQARARAIRSQLALEPVTKIEVDTDSDEEEEKSKKSAPAQSNKKLTKTTNGRAAPSKPDATKRSANAKVPISKPNSESASSAPSKRIKLKRNFRKQTRDDDSNDDAKKTEQTSKATEKIEPKKEARSPSPDVIPIIAVPETLCISDSDDEKIQEKSASKNVEKSKPVESSRTVEILSVVSIEAPKKQNDNTDSTESNETESQKDTAPVEAEEGEILEEEDKSKVDPPSANKTESVTESDAPKVDESDIGVDTKEKIVPKETSEVSNEKEEQQTTPTVEDKKITEASVNRPESVDSSESDNGTNDDVISLEGGDLLNEMKEHLEDDDDEPKEMTPAEEVICLDDSSEEETKTKKESWNERWLKSSKVSKVLAASRLGNRVRNKIKESRKAKKLEEAAVIESEQTKPQEVVFSSRHEDGSVEQYKELLENVQKKTD